ncbi:hypothetical protein CCACVL1_01752 [Corchorus capsularis]|uniref:Uncharacterized protein n=1 Tax=Corchorus capsularis TaxID=210143 RepID=A0A1R3KG18_COCAP|nr:hypothetical protein CCACVL1_01752 [Corchorus capsularis]
MALQLLEIEGDDISKESDLQSQVDTGSRKSLD